jgi:outer membrane murein-binding lipoprotein Lpp
MAALSEWLQIMLAEIARKREDLERAREEERARGEEAERATEKVDASVRRAS